MGMGEVRHRTQSAWKLEGIVLKRGTRSVWETGREWMVVAWKGTMTRKGETEVHDDDYMKLSRLDTKDWNYLRCGNWDA